VFEAAGEYVIYGEVGGGVTTYGAPVAVFEAVFGEGAGAELAPFGVVDLAPFGVLGCVQGFDARGAAAAAYDDLGAVASDAHSAACHLVSCLRRASSIIRM